MNTEFNRATRIKRFFAYILDSLTILPFYYFSGWQFGLFEYDNISLAPLTLLLSVGSFNFAAYIFINYIHLKNGQTWGKHLVGIRIVGSNGNPISVKELLLKRFFFQYVIASVPKVGFILALIDIMFIFSENKRCLHDYLAKTHVVNE
ncbi:MAG: putative RDD family membrane protein YckC [Candidatus Endobugula sp.]|jgi:uncharacterized RDD family membrane protein YckC